MTNNTGTGFLKISVTTANGTLPVEGAVVTVSEYSAAGDGRIISSQRTGRGGNTVKISLPVVAAAESESPGDAQPYSLFNIAVQYDGYYPVELVAVPVFDSIVCNRCNCISFWRN